MGAAHGDMRPSEPCPLNVVRAGKGIANPNAGSNERVDGTGGSGVSTPTVVFVLAGATAS